MGPYSHFVLAGKIESLVRPENEGEYYWGSIVPDIRYLAGMRRSQTHINEQRIREFITRYPHQKSFIQGYRVHCLLDEIDLQDVVGKVFPLNIINLMFNGKISQPQLAVLVEVYYLQTFPTDRPISGGQNEILAEMGIQSTHVDKFRSAMQEYFRSPCFESAFSTFQHLGMVDDSRAAKYMSAARKMQKYTLLRNLLLLGVKNADLNRLAIKHVSSSLTQQ